MNVIYSCCIADPFIEVALRLQKQYQWDPVYWIGDKSTIVEGDQTEQLVRESFPQCIYHDFFDAWHGIFPKEINEIGADTYVDIDFLREFSCQELQTITMMDRQDFDRRSFCNMERERYFIRLVKYFSACLNVFKPTYVISAVNPHRVFDYVLYLLCQHRNIPYVSFQYTLSLQRIFPLVGFSDFDKISSLFQESYTHYLNQAGLEENDLPKDIKDSYERSSSDYKVARPQYMYKSDIRDKQRHNPFFVLKRFFTINHFVGKKSVFRGARPSIFKNHKYSIENTRFSFYDWYTKRMAAMRHDNRMKKLYRQLAKPVDTSVPYVVFYLHYQPEATTSPAGDIFVNQQLCVEMLLKHTPENYMVYVKEHPNQFGYHTTGHTKRIPDFYHDLVSYSRVRLVPLEMDSFSIMQNAKAVATITGTVGWEAALHKKPVIVFGEVWYEGLKNVLRVYNEKTASQINAFITSYQFDGHSILAYLHALADNSILAYHYDGYRKAATISKDECADHIVLSLEKLLELKKNEY